MDGKRIVRISLFTIGNIFITTCVISLFFIEENNERWYLHKTEDIKQATQDGSLLKKYTCIKANFIQPDIFNEYFQNIIFWTEAAHMISSKDNSASPVKVLSWSTLPANKDLKLIIETPTHNINTLYSPKYKIVSNQYLPDTFKVKVFEKAFLSKEFTYIKHK